VVLVEGKDLRTHPRGARARLTTMVTAVIAVMMTATVTAPAPAEAATSHVYEAMPNFVGMGRASVFAEMYHAQLYYKTQGVGANSTRWNRVVSEIPAAGTLIHPFSTVILTVTTVPVITVDAVVHHATVVTVHRHVVRTPVTHRHVVTRPTTKKTVKKPVTTKPTHTHVVTRPTTKKTVKKPVTTKPTHTHVVAHPGKRPTKVVHHKVVRQVVADFRVGVATWYSYIPGQCASWYLPRGTRINVEDLNTHKVISCVVTDHEEAHGTRVVDLSETQFSELAPLGVGVVPVRVTW